MESENQLIRELSEFIEDAPGVFASYRGVSYSFGGPDELPKPVLKEAVRNLNTRLKALFADEAA